MNNTQMTGERESIAWQHVSEELWPSNEDEHISDASKGLKRLILCRFQMDFLVDFAD
jgi:hypothetical protein